MGYMMDEEEFEDHLVDRAKEILNDQLESGEEDLSMDRKRNRMDEKAEQESTSRIPFSWDPREVEKLTRNREKMTNEELEEFFEKDSNFHEKLSELDEWNGFSRWEERLILQRQSQESASSIAEELDRDPEEVELKMHMMGFLPDE